MSKVIPAEITVVIKGHGMAVWMDSTEHNQRVHLYYRAYNPEHSLRLASSPFIRRSSYTRTPINCLWMVHKFDSSDSSHDAAHVDSLFSHWLNDRLRLRKSIC